MELILHAGTGKAGSTSIQFFCRDNRARLAQHGILYPLSAGRVRHEGLSMAIKSDEELANTPTWHRRKHQDPQRFRRNFRRRLRAEIEESGVSRVLLSDEEVFGLSEEALRRLADLVGRLFDRVRMIVYLRRQDEHMVSRYQQGVKIGWVARLEDFAREDMSDRYEYAARLRRHEQLVAPAEITVRRFDRSAFAGGSLIHDFVESLGLTPGDWDLTAQPNRNQSLDAESVEFLRLLNLYRVEHEGAAVGLIDNRSIVKRLAPVSTGPTLTLPEHALDRFMAQWEESNREVARRYLGEDELFPTSRRTSGTTSRQYLDPHRLDHFLALAELPEQIHSPLRRLAEQEAARDTAPDGTKA